MLLDIARPYKPETFGSSSFQTPNDIRVSEINNKGEGRDLSPYVGILKDTRYPGPPVKIFAKNEGHLLTVAPTRSGKGTGQIIPNLLRWEGSAIVIDIKGENYLKTAGYRAKKLKQRIVRFAPFETVSEKWNPILSIRASSRSDESTPEEQEDVRYLSNLLISPSGSSNDKFWENSAKNFLEGLLLHVRTARLSDDSVSIEPEDECKVRERSMREVRRLLTLDDEAFTCLLDSMKDSRRSIVKQAGNSMLRQFNKGDGRTGTSILAVAEEQTAVWAYDRLQQVTYVESEGDDHEPGENDFNFKELRDGKTTLYIIIPPDYLTEYRIVLRVLIGMAMRELRQNFDSRINAPPILFLLDEFPQLAYMRPIEEALLYMAGYGARFWFFVQDVSQIKLHYPKSWRTFMANTGTQSFFGISDIETANLVSETAGTATVVNRGFVAGININETKTITDLKGRATTSSSGTTYQDGKMGSNHSKGETISDSHSEGISKGYGENFSSQVGFVGRRLITPDEAMRLREDEQIIFMKGMKPIRCILQPYYTNDQAKKDSEIAPPEDVSFL